MKNFLNIVKIDSESMKPKYRQLAEAIVEGVKMEIIEKGDTLPSIHDFCVALDVSKNTIEKAYNTLKKQGIIGSYRGKGFYILSDKNIAA